MTETISDRHGGHMLFSKNVVRRFCPPKTILSENFSLVGWGNTTGWTWIYSEIGSETLSETCENTCFSLLLLPTTFLRLLTSSCKVLNFWDSFLIILVISAMTAFQILQTHARAKKRPKGDSIVGSCFYTWKVHLL